MRPATTIGWGSRSRPSLKGPPTQRLLTRSVSSCVNAGNRRLAAAAALDPVLLKWRDRLSPGLVDASGKIPGVVIPGVTPGAAARAMHARTHARTRDHTAHHRPHHTARYTPRRNAPVPRSHNPGRKKTNPGTRPKNPMFCSNSVIRSEPKQFDISKNDELICHSK